MKKTFLKNEGFTLVETLVAIAILVLAVTGAFSAAQSGISSSIFSKNQVIAFYLAGEGVEQILNTRQENILKGQDWLTGLASTPTDNCYFGKSCTVDVVNNTTFQCSGPGACPVLKQDPVNGFYAYNAGWTDTIFRREIKLTQINANEVAILVRITWSKGTVNRQFDIRENILNWQ